MQIQKLFTTILFLLVACQTHPAWSQIVDFETESTATQTITSSIFGGTVGLQASGMQLYTFDLDSGDANVQSLFQGADLPDPFDLNNSLTYDLYNTTTTGNIVENQDGLFDIQFDLLFEFEITSGLLNGFIAETTTTVEFSTLDTDLPFPEPTFFPSFGPAELFVKFDPTGNFSVGDTLGFSDDRLVTINRNVPEPTSSLIFMGLVMGLAIASPPLTVRSVIF